MPISEVSLVWGRWEERWIAALQRQKNISVFQLLDRKTSKKEIKFPKEFFSIHIMRHLTCYQLAHRDHLPLGFAFSCHMPSSSSCDHITLTPCVSTGPEQAICPQSTLVYGFRYKRQVFIWHTVSRKMSCFIHSVINHYAKCFMLSTKSRLQREMNYSKSKSITGKERRVLSQACCILPAA